MGIGLEWKLLVTVTVTYFKATNGPALVLPKLTLISVLGIKWEVIFHGCKMSSFYTFWEVRLLSMIHHMDW